MRKISYAVIFILALVLTACGNKTNTPAAETQAETKIETTAETTAETVTETAAETVTNTTEETAAETTAVTVTESAAPVRDITFEDISRSTFEFSSGAGAWMTNMNIERDGSFSGEYHDSDMGDQSESYKNGTVYLSRFTGQFTDLEKVDDYTYHFKIDKIRYRYEPGTEEYMDDFRFIYSTAYGLDKGENFYIHCPGKAMSELSEDVYNWIFMAAQNKQTLEFYVIENREQGQAFYSYPRQSVAEEAKQILDGAEATYNSIEKDLTTKDMPQIDLEFTAKRMDDETDYSLNRLWNLIKNNTDEATYNKLLEEQRSWLTTRDKTVEEKTKDSKGGSIYGMLVYMERAKLTIERCRELAKVLTH